MSSDPAWLVETLRPLVKREGAQLAPWSLKSVRDEVRGMSPEHAVRFIENIAELLDSVEGRLLSEQRAGRESTARLNVEGEAGRRLWLSDLNMTATGATSRWQPRTNRRQRHECSPHLGSERAGKLEVRVHSLHLSREQEFRLAAQTDSGLDEEWTVPPGTKR